MERTRLIAGVVLVLAIAAALIYVVVTQSRGVDQPTTAAEPTASAEAPPPSPVNESTPTPDPQEAEPIAVPTPDTTGRDFDKIFREMFAFRDWLFANPTPEHVRVIYHPDCDCYASLTEQLETLVENRYRFDDEGFRVLDVAVVEEFESLVRLHVELQRSSQILVDQDGDVVEERDERPREILNVILVRGSADSWRIRAIEELP